MSFFVTSANPGQAAESSGVEGADAHGASLAEADGVTGKTWRAYLLMSTENARDRIGIGPWFDAEGVETLHGDANAVSKETALDESGGVINGRGTSRTGTTS